MAAAFDVIVVGGGPAGLAAALAITRMMQTVLVFDSGEYRNRFSEYMHTISTWDHRSSLEYRKSARAELLASRYSTAKIIDAKINSLTRMENGLFKASIDSGTEWTAKKVILAVGSRDKFPDISGFADCWGKGIFHCLFCHGFEAKGSKEGGILAIDDLAMIPAVSMMVKQCQQFAQSVTIYTHGGSMTVENLGLPDAGNSSSSNGAEVKAHGAVKIDKRKIRSLKLAGDDQKVIVTFADGEQETMDFVVHKPRCEPGGTFWRQLGLKVTPAGDFEVRQPFLETSVGGCHAAGDCAQFMKSIPTAIASGMTAGAGASMSLLK